MRHAALMLVLGVGASALVLVGCSSSRSAQSPTLAPEDFVAPQPEIAENIEDTPGETPAIIPNVTIVPKRVISLDGSFRATTGAPSAPRTAQRLDAPQLIDAKVGEVNGRAIFADEFFEPLATRLIAESSIKPRPEWINFTRDRVREELDRIIEDELLVAEALESLSPQQQQGLRYFLRNMRDRLRSLNYGSATTANRKIQEQTGLTEDEFIRNKEREILIGEQLRPIKRRIHVTRRDVELAYEQSNEAFDPKPEATFLIIRVPTDDQPAIDAVNEALAQDGSFEEVAESDLNKFASRVFKVEYEHPYESASLFSPRTLPNTNAAAQKLSAGQWAGPIQDASGTFWILLESVRELSVPRYDAQVILAAFIRKRLEDLARAKFIAELRERGSFSDVSAMTEELVRIAADRYWQPGG